LEFSVGIFHIWKGAYEGQKINKIWKDVAYINGIFRKWKGAFEGQKNSIKYGRMLHI